MRDEYRMTVLNYKVLRETFGHKREMITGGWKKLSNEELHTSQLSADYIRARTTRKMRSTGHVATVGQRGEIHRRFWWKTLKERPVRRPSLR